MIPRLPLASIEHERRLRLESRANDGAEAAGQFEQALAEIDDAQLTARARAAYEFARNLPYAHPGLSAASYMAHPVRVAIMAMRLVSPPYDAVVLALLHNVFEHTDVSEAEIGVRFGAPIAAAIRVLTVDRARQDDAYKRLYYEAIRTAPSWTRAVKVLDKLDNMFVLGLNPSESVRQAYLREIEQYVLPLARSEFPQLAQYLVEVIQDCRAVGHLSDVATHTGRRT
jgi:(p)ppGpp synthase/HD superfamily hydrolase